EVLQRDPPDGKPGNGHVAGGPADVIQRDRPGGGLGAGGVDRADGQVIGCCLEGAASLLRGVGAEPELYLRRATGELRGSNITGLEEVFLSQMASKRAQFPGDGWVVIDDKAHPGLLADGQNALAQPPDNVRRG